MVDWKRSDGVEKAAWDNAICKGVCASLADSKLNKYTLQQNMYARLIGVGGHPELVPVEMYLGCFHPLLPHGRIIKLAQLDTIMDAVFEERARELQK